MDVAKPHYEEAQRLAQALPDVLVQPMIKMWFGRHLARRGGDDTPRGIALLQDAVADFEARGMLLHRDRAFRWLSDAQLHPMRPS